MKKFFAILLSLALILGMVPAAAAETVPTNCQHCGEAVTWKPVKGNTGLFATAGHHHLYLSEDYTGAQLNATNGAVVCLDLNGKQILTDGRALHIGADSQMNVMDSVGGGQVIGTTGSNNPSGGALAVGGAGGICNIYGGTYRLQTDEVGQGVGTGGIIGMNAAGTINMYGGKVLGADLVFSNYPLTNNGRGAAVYLAAGQLNVYGGEITSGTLPVGGRGECVYLLTASATVTLSGNAKVEQIYAERAGSVNVSGAYTGKSRIFFGSAVTPADQLKIGTAANADLSAADLMCLNGKGWNVAVSGAELRLATFTPTGARHMCAHCGDIVDWLPLASNIAKTQQEGHHHLYLSGKYETKSQLVLNNDAQVCLDLYGQDIESSTRAIHVTQGVLNLMDTVGGGSVIGRTGSNNPDAGAVAVKSAGVLNMYSGTVEFIKGEAGYGTGRGGAMLLEGTLNLYGGTIKGGDMVKSTYPYPGETYNGCGGAIFLNAKSELNLYGGKVLSGTVPADCYGPCIFVRESTAKINLSGDAEVEDIFFVTNVPDSFHVVDTYTGKVNLTYKETVALNVGTVVGYCADADVSAAEMYCGDKFILNNDGNLTISSYGNNSVAAIYTESGNTGYDSLQQALEAYTTGEIRLLKDTAEDVTIRKDTYMDLAGQSVTGTVTIADGATFYGMDSQTDDFDVADGIYGQLTVQTQGTGKVTGAALSENRDNYLLVTQDGRVSFHRVQLQVYAMTLRSQVAGVYYKSYFHADQVAATVIDTFGVALSAKEEPNEQNMGKTSKYSYFTGFQAGPEGNTGKAGSTLLTGILKESNNEATNKRNLNVPVYGRAYVQLTDGPYVFGQTVEQSLLQQLEGVDAMVDSLSVTQLESLLEMYETYRDLLKRDSLSKIEEALQTNGEGTLKILMFGNSHGMDATWLLPEVFRTEQPGKKIVVGTLYHSGCTMATHAQHVSENMAAYTYYKNDGSNPGGAWSETPNSTLLDALQDEQWDIVVLQQQNEKNGLESFYTAEDFKTVINFIREHQDVAPKLLWQMLWVNPDDYSRYIGTNAPLAHPNAEWYQTYYETNFAGADGKYDHEVLYNKIVTLTQKYLTDTTQFLGEDCFEYVIPSATAVEYVLDVVGRPQYEMYRDWTHLSDYGRLVAAYQWYASIMGLDSISQVNVDAIPAALHQTKSTYPADLKVNDAMKQDIISAVNWTIENHYQLPEERPSTTRSTAYFAEDPADDDTFRLLMVGNSACLYYADELYAMLAGTGIKAEIYNVYYSGCNVKSHWTWLNTNEANYRLDCNSSEGKVSYPNMTLEECLLTANWDVITLQQAVFPQMCYDEKATLNVTLPYANNLLTYFRERFPKADFKWHQVWAFEIGFYPLSGEMQNAPDEYKVLDVEKRNLYYKMLCTVADAVCQQNDLPLIPTGDAWEIARKSELIGTTLCARLGVRGDEGDYGHDGDIGGGQYLNACVWFEILTGESCLGNTFRPSYELSEEKIAILQAAAHQAVADRKAE